MFNNKTKTETGQEKPAGTGTTLVGAETKLKGDIHCNSDIRIDGAVEGNITCSSKIVIGANGLVTGNVTGKLADIVGKVNGHIKVADLLQLRGSCVVNGNLFAGKLQVEPTATFNGECHMGANVVEMKELNEIQSAAVAL
jgi:cytoskeletal protein CcmA (bactofilin family)